MDNGDGVRIILLHPLEWLPLSAFPPVKGHQAGEHDFFLSLCNNG